MVEKAAMEVTTMELGHTGASKCFDDDGRPKRTGKDDDPAPSRANPAHGIHQIVYSVSVVVAMKAPCGRRARTLSRR
jgi:hypothetical protein